MPQSTALSTLTFDDKGALELKDVGACQELAVLIVSARMAPQGMDSPEKVTLGLMHARMVGLPALFALQHMAVIGNRVSLDGTAALALCENSGLLEDIEEWVEGEGDARTAYCKVKRKGRNERTSGFSVRDAKRAGLWDERPTARQRSKENPNAWVEAPNSSPWFCYPDRMLQMRARGFRLRDSFSDRLGGLFITEELYGATIEGEVLSRSMADLATPPQPPAPPEPPEPPRAPEPPPEPPQPPEAAKGPPEPPSQPAGQVSASAAGFLSDDEAERIEAAYLAMIERAQSEHDVDLAWNTHIGPIADRLTQERYGRMQAIDDDYRQRVDERTAG